MAKRRVYRKGMIAEIRFLDHVEDGEDPIEFFVYGKIIAVKRKHIVMACWVYSDTRENDSNNKIFTILRSTIQSWVELVPKVENVNITDTA